MSFRTRLLGTSLLTLAVGLGALVLVGNVLLARLVAGEAADALRARAETQIAAVDVRADGVRPRETTVDAALDRAAWVLSGDRVVERPAHVAPRVDTAVVALARRGQSAEREVADDLHVRVEPLVHDGRRVGAVAVTFDVAALERVQASVLGGSLVLAALVLLAGWLAIRRAIGGALQPVAQMTRDATDWSEHDLDRRFALGPARDELTALAATLDDMLARIAASRRHEQRFASEVAHELRTPIAGLRARAELALGGDDEAERAAALEAVVAQSDRLSAAIDALLAVARNEHGAAAGTTDLAALAAEADGVEVAPHDPVPPVEGDPELVRRALAPLVENARRHARATVRLELTADVDAVRLAVRDDGPGVDPDAPIFDPGVSTSGGAGLGLPLARRLARSCGGDVVLGEGPGGCFVLVLPAAR